MKETEAAGEEETPSGQEMQQEESAVSSASATLQQNTGSDPSASPETRQNLVSDPPSTEDRQGDGGSQAVLEAAQQNDSNEQSIPGQNSRTRTMVCPLWQKNNRETAARLPLRQRELSRISRLFVRARQFIR